jgi:hypothetical protein
MSHGSFSDIHDPKSDEIDHIGQQNGGSEDDEQGPTDVLEERKSKLNTLFGFQPWDLPLSRAAAEYVPPPDTGEGSPAVLSSLFSLPWS